MGVPSYNVASRVDGVDPYTGVKPRRFMRVRAAVEEAFGPRQISTAWRRFAVTHVAAGPNTDAASRAMTDAAVAGGAPALHDGGLDLSVFEVPHRPWAFFANSVAPAASEEAARRRLLDLLENGGDAVVVEGLDARPPGARAHPVCPARFRARTGRGGVGG